MLDNAVKGVLDGHALELEKRLNGDVLAYHGEINSAFVKRFRNEVEALARRDTGRDRLIFLLTTGGGIAEATEDMSDIIRNHYKEVFFVVPDYAMSAGTILCMSGDKIFMDYSSSLGPIDPQIMIQEAGQAPQMVPALGYLDKMEEIVEKSRNDTITPVEFKKFQNTDLAMLSRYEQAKSLSIALLKKWLVDYKFKDWNKHSTNPDKIGRKVTLEEKEERAGEIASMLSDNNTWHSHGRRISINTLRTNLRLIIDDYGETPDIQKTIRVYNDVMADYAVRERYPLFIHTAR